MVEDGRAGLFDLIITKEITQFARNTLDSIQYTQKLLWGGLLPPEVGGPAGQQEQQMGVLRKLLMPIGFTHKKMAEQ